MIKIIWYLEVGFNWLVNLKKIYFFREFFVFYLQKISALKLPKNKLYLTKFYGFVSGQCPRDFLFYAPAYMEPYIKEISQKLFNDKESRELYRRIFLRNIYASHFMEGWDTYFDSDKVFFNRLSKVKSAINSEVEFFGNFFTTKTNKDSNFSLGFNNGSKYILPLNWFEVSVFSYRLGLTSFGDKYLEHVMNNYIVDVGAFIGDSSIVLAEYTNKKVLAIEPNIDNFALLKKTIRFNNLKDKIEPLNVALDKDKKKVGIFNHGAGSSIIAASDKNSMMTTTMDTLVTGKYQKIGLIKMDVEGYEMNILLGSRNIIRRDKPILLISIYHNGDQFINIPLYLKEKYSEIYNFKFIDCNPLHPMSEKVLLCLPK